MDFHRIKKIIKQKHTLQSHEWKGAVLFLCNEEYVFFIKRSESMPTHRGQIAFVGGHKKENESDPLIVAQREFEEETGLKSDTVHILGYLQTVMTAGLQPIVPVLGKVLIPTTQFLNDIHSNGEWDNCIAYPWSELKNEKKWEFGWRQGKVRFPVLFHYLNQEKYYSKFSKDENHLLWGATANIVWDFLRLYYEFRES